MTGLAWSSPQAVKFAGWTVLPPAAATQNASNKLPILQEVAGFYIMLYLDVPGTYLQRGFLLGLP